MENLDLVIVDLNEELVKEMEQLRYRAFGIDMEVDEIPARLEYMKDNYNVLALYGDIDGKRTLLGGAYVHERLCSLYIDELFVEPAYQHYYLGTKMLDYITEMADTFSVKYGIRLGTICLESLPSAEGFYEKNRFHKGIHGNYYKHLI